MNSKEMLAASHDEIAQLAYLNWEKEGRPPGQDQKYWLEAEQQIRATGHLLISELSPPGDQSLVGAKSRHNETPKKPRRVQQEQSFSRS